MCQWARGAAGPLFTHLAFVGLLALLAAASVCAASFAMAYQRHFSRMAELSGTQAGSWRWRLGFWERILDRVVLRTAYEQAGFRFVVRSLFRSDRHRAAVAVFAAVGFVAASELLMGSGAAADTPTTAQFAAPLIILYCAILGIRSTFDLPLELNANWIFRLLLAPTLDECAVLAGKSIFLLVLPLIVVMAVVFGLRWSVLCGLLELLVSAVLAATLIAGLVLAYRKLPFTCAKSGFQHNALVKALLCVLGVFAFAFLPALVEHWARSSPVRLLVLAPLLALIWWGIREARSAQLDIDRQIVFLDPVQSGVELLNLNA